MPSLTAASGHNGAKSRPRALAATRVAVSRVGACFASPCSGCQLKDRWFLLCCGALVAVSGCRGLPGGCQRQGMCWLVVRLHLPVRAGRRFLSSWGCWFRCTAHEAADTLTAHRQSHQEQSQAPSPSPNQSLCGRWQRLSRGLQGRPAGDYSPKCDDCSTAPRPSGPAGVAQRHQPSARGLPGCSPLCRNPSVMPGVAPNGLGPDFRAAPTARSALQPHL